MQALDEGADDYLIKPFGLQELLARIRAVLRRSRQPGSGSGQLLQHGPLAVDLRTHKVTMSGNHIAVTPKEFAILECLASDPGRVVSRQEMLERAQARLDGKKDAPLVTLISQSRTAGGRPADPVRPVPGAGAGEERGDAGGHLAHVRLPG